MLNHRIKTAMRILCESLVWGSFSMCTESQCTSLIHSQSYHKQSKVCMYVLPGQIIEEALDLQPKKCSELCIRLTVYIDKLANQIIWSELQDATF